MIAKLSASFVSHEKLAVPSTTGLTLSPVRPRRRYCTLRGSCTSVGSESDRHPPRAGNEIGREPLRRAGELDVVHTRQHLGEQRIDLDARDVLAEAHVRAAAERDVRIGRAADVERLRVRKR